MMLRSCKVAIVAVIGPLTTLHLDFFLMLAAAAAQARATSIFPSLCTSSSPWSSSQVRSWSSENQIPGSPFSPNWKCGIVVAHAILILFPARICCHNPLMLDRTRAHAHCSVSVRRRWQDPSLEQFHCLVFGLQPVLYHLDVGVSFAAPLLPLVLNLD